MFSSKVRVAAVLAGLLLAAPALSFAQGPGGGGGGRGGFGGRGGGGLGSLTRMEEVQKEIKVTDEQKAELTKLAEAARAAGPGGGGAPFDFEAFNKLSDEEKAKQMAERTKAREEQTKKSDEAIKAILKPEQVARLSELRVQREEVAALAREEFQKHLGLTAEQVAKIKTLTDANRPAGFGGGRGGPGGGGNPADMSEEDRQKLFDEMKAKREAYNKDMAAVLTADQTAAWEKAKGAKFEFPAGGGRGGPGGGAGGGGGGGRRRPE